MNLKSRTQKEMQSNILKFYIFSFFSEFTIFLPFLTYYFQEAGFSLGKISILFSVAAATIFIFEVPSGYVADRIGRKKTLILSAIFLLIGTLLLLSSTDFPILVISQLFNGLSAAFISGADSAFLYDTLLTIKKEKEYKKIIGKARFFAEIALILSAIIGSLIVSHGIKITIFATAISYAFVAILVFSFKEPPKKITQKHKLHLDLNDLYSIIKKSIHNRKLLGLFFYSMIMLGISTTIFMIYQPYFRATGVDLKYFGYIFAAFSVFAAFSSLKAEEIEKKIGIAGSFIFMPIFIAFALIGSSIVFIWAGFIFFFLRELVRGYIYPVLSDYTNRLVDSDKRATVLSLGSMFSRVGEIIIWTVFGFFSDMYGIKTMLLIFGILLLFFTLIVPFIIQGKRKIAFY